MVVIIDDATQYWIDLLGYFFQGLSAFVQVHSLELLHDARFRLLTYTDTRYGFYLARAFCSVRSWTNGKAETVKSLGVFRCRKTSKIDNLALLSVQSQFASFHPMLDLVQHEFCRSL